MDYSQLAANTMELLKPFLLAQGSQLANDGMSAVREKLFGWLKARFIKPAQSAVLTEAVESPEDTGALEALQSQLRRALEQNEEFRKELLELLPQEFHPQTRQNMSQTGDNNKGIQNTGSGNTISIQ